jgi:hypothetical protein
MDAAIRLGGWLVGGIVALASTAGAQQALARDPIIITITDEEGTAGLLGPAGGEAAQPPAPSGVEGVFPDQGRHSTELFPDQAAAVAAAYAGEPWRSGAHCRAGWPSDLRCRTAPSDTGRYCGYYVGGGAPFRGEGRLEHEGTWGWDYVGILIPRRVWLQWWHGKPQGGAGAYKTDGPKLRHH